MAFRMKMVVLVPILAASKFESTVNAETTVKVARTLAERNASSPALIDPVTMPECSTSSCWHWGAPPPTVCPLVRGPCANNSQASDNGGSTCGINRYTQECYCSRKTGLSCAWSCSWRAWWDIEDWFAKVCPDSVALRLDFSGLPDCARGCLDDASFEYGCLTQSSNCFCAHGDLFGCQDKCHAQTEWTQIEKWLQGACDITAANAKIALQQGYFYLSSESLAGSVREKGPPRPGPQQPLTWSEKFILTVIATTVVVGFGIWISHCVAGRNRKRWNKLG